MHVNCFVIQRFDNGGPFDKRYGMTLAPAINDAGLVPYRVDEDPSASIPIESIEKGIREAAICLADISVDNPNVWYEVGYANAGGTPVVMICNVSRERFPFDVQHKSIIKYDTQSPDDFDRLKSSITARLKAELKKAESCRTIRAQPTFQVEGLEPYEITTLIFMMEERVNATKVIAAYPLRQQLGYQGLTDIAVNLALASLETKGMIQSADGRSWDRMENRESSYPGFLITEKGRRWIAANASQFQMTQPKSQYAVK